MSITGQYQHIKIFSCFNEGICHFHRMRRMNRIIHITCHEQQTTFIVFSQVHICFAGREICNFLMFIAERIFHHFFTFPHAIMNLDPPLIIHVIIVITRRCNCCRIKIRIRANSGSSHKTTSGVTINTDFLPVNKRITISQLFYHVLIVC